MAVYTQTIRTDTADSVPNLRAMEGQGRRTADAMEQTAKSAKKVEDRTDQLGTRAGKTASAMGMLGGVLGRIDPALEDAARGVADVADSLDAATMFGSSLFRVLGPVGVALAGLGAAYVVLNKQLEAANERMAEQAQRAEDMANLHNQVKEAALLASLAEGEITQERFNQIVASRTAADLFSEMRSERQSALMDAASELELEKERLQTLQTFIDTKRQQLGEAELQRQFPIEIQDLQNQIATVELLENARTRAARQLGQATNAEFEYSQNLETVANSQNEVTEAVKTGTEAIKEMNFHVVDLSDAFFVLHDILQGIEDMEFAENIQGAASAIDAAMAAAQAEQFVQSMDRPQRTASDIAGSIQTGLSLAAGNLGALGPIGGIIGGLATIGEMGAEGVEDKLDNLKESIIGGVRALPEILVDIIPEFVVALVTELPGAIADALSELFRRLFNLIPGVDIQEPGEGEKSLIRQLFSEEGLVLYTEEQGFGVRKNNPNLAGSSSRSAAASTRGRMVRADGAQRLAMSRAPTSTMFGQGATVIQQALGFDSGTQDRFQRRFSQLIDADTGLRGRT